MIYIGIDLGLRSNGIVALDKNERLINMNLISTSKSEPNTAIKNYNVYNDEELFIYIEDKILDFISWFTNEDVTIAIEGLSYDSISSSKDILAGIHWHIRTVIYKEFGVKPIIIPPKKWQKGIMSPEDEIEIKLKYLSEDLDKVGPFEKCPYKRKILDFIHSYSLTNFCKDDAHYDISDAYWIAKYLFSKNLKK